MLAQRLRRRANIEPTLGVLNWADVKTFFCAISNAPRTAEAWAKGFGDAGRILA